MAKAYTPAATADPTKKAFKKLITQNLEDALAELKPALGEKKFHQRIKKAVKILSEDFTAVVPEAPAPVAPAVKETVTAPVEKKKPVTKKKAVKKAVVKKVKKSAPAVRRKPY